MYFLLHLVLFYYFMIDTTYFELGENQHVYI